MVRALVALASTVGCTRSCGGKVGSSENPPAPQQLSAKKNLNVLNGRGEPFGPFPCAVRVQCASDDDKDDDAIVLIRFLQSLCGKNDASDPHIFADRACPLVRLFRSLCPPLGSTT